MPYFLSYGKHTKWYICNGIIFKALTVYRQLHQSDLFKMYDVKFWAHFDCDTVVIETKLNQHTK